MAWIFFGLVRPTEALTWQPKLDANTSARPVHLHHPHLLQSSHYILTRNSQWFMMDCILVAWFMPCRLVVHGQLADMPTRQQRSQLTHSDDGCKLSWVSCGVRKTCAVDVVTKRPQAIISRPDSSASWHVGELTRYRGGSCSYVRKSTCSVLSISGSTNDVGATSRCSWLMSWLPSSLNASITSRSTVTSSSVSWFATFSDNTSQLCQCPMQVYTI